MSILYMIILILASVLLLVLAGFGVVFFGAWAVYEIKAGLTSHGRAVAHGASAPRL